MNTNTTIEANEQADAKKFRNPSHRDAYADGYLHGLEGFGHGAIPQAHGGDRATRKAWRDGARSAS